MAVDRNRADMREGNMNWPTAAVWKTAPTNNGPVRL